MYKRYFVIGLVIIAAVLLLSACGGKPTEEVIPFNEKITGEIKAGDTAAYSFRGEEGMTIFLEQLDSSAWLTFTLTGPDEFEIFSERGLGDDMNRVQAGPLHLRESGIYVIEIGQRDDEATEFSFILWNVEPAVIESDFQFNSLSKGEIAIPGQKVQYTFEGSAGQHIFVNQRDSDPWVNFTLVGPDGLDVFSERGLSSGLNAVNHGETLKQDGTYNLIVDCKGADRGAFEFVLWDVEPAVIEGGAVEFEQLIKGEFTIPGQTAEYTFTGVAGQQLVFEQKDSDDWMFFKLVGPDGLELFEERGTGPGLNRVVAEVALKQDGTYTIIISPTGGNKGAFEFIVTTDMEVDEVEEEEEEEDDEPTDD